MHIAEHAQGKQDAESWKNEEETMVIHPLQELFKGLSQRFQRKKGKHKENPPHSVFSSYGFRFGETIVPWRKAVCNSGFKQKQESQELHSKGCAAQRGRDACGTAPPKSASQLRRLSVFFGGAPDQAPKAAKFAVLIPGHAGFPKRVERSEGSDTTPI